MVRYKREEAIFNTKEGRKERRNRLRDTEGGGHVVFPLLYTALEMDEMLFMLYLIDYKYKRR